MVVGVADTHTILWYLSRDNRLSNAGRSFMESARINRDQIGISSISLVEIVYLIEKGRIPVESLTRLAAALERLPRALLEVPLDLAVARTLPRIDIFKVPDMPDRIIAAAALHLGVPLISRDAKIRISGITTIW